MLTPSFNAPTVKVAIYRTSSIGDVVLATALLDLLDKLPISAEITWVGRNPSLTVVGTFWPLVRTIEVKRSSTVLDQEKLARDLAGTHLFIDLQCNIRSRFLSQLLRTRHKVPTFSTEKSQLRRSRLLIEARLRGRRKPLPVRSLKAPRLQYETMTDTLIAGLNRYLPIERRDGLEATVYWPRLPALTTDSLQPAWRKELRFGCWLAIAPGAAHPTKQAPMSLFIDTLLRLQKALDVANGSAPHGQGLGLLFLGDESDRAFSREIIDHLNKDGQWPGPILNLAGRASLPEAALALREASALISNDSSLGHIAEAVDTPTAILFGPTIESFGFSPRMRQSRAFSVMLGCRPCSKHGKIPCRYGDQLCFAGMPIPEIVTHLLNLLTSPDAKHRHRNVTTSLGSTIGG